jgi:hypothetical protein
MTVQSPTTGISADACMYSATITVIINLTEIIKHNILYVYRFINPKHKILSEIKCIPNKIVWQVS